MEHVWVLAYQLVFGNPELEAVIPGEKKRAASFQHNIYGPMVYSSNSNWRASFSGTAGALVVITVYRLPSHPLQHFAEKPIQPKSSSVNSVLAV